MGNAYLDKLDAKKQASVEATQITIQQLMLDTAQVVLHREYGWGYDRIKQFTDAWGEYYDEIFQALQKPKSILEDDRDIYRQRLDDAIKDILKDNQQLIPFMKRYPYAEKVTYERRKK